MLGTCNNKRLLLSLRPRCRRGDDADGSSLREDPHEEDGRDEGEADEEDHQPDGPVTRALDVRLESRRLLAKTAVVDVRHLVRLAQRLPTTDTASSFFTIIFIIIIIVIFYHHIFI